MILWFSYFLVELEAIDGIGANQTNENMQHAYKGGRWSKKKLGAHGTAKRLVYKKHFYKTVRPKFCIDESSATLHLSTTNLSLLLGVTQTQYLLGKPTSPQHCKK